MDSAILYNYNPRLNVRQLQKTRQDNIIVVLFCLLQSHELLKPS